MNVNKINIKRNLYETDESYKRRKWFINQAKPKNEKELKEYIVLANAWVNTLFLGCIYPTFAMNRIKSILVKSNYNKKN